MDASLLRRFESPPSRYRGMPFWAWNGKLEEAELRRQIRVMHQMGLGGAFMHSRVGLATPYLSKQWFDLTEACADECEKLGMEADDVSSMPVEKKLKVLYDHRQDQYQKLADAVYFRRGWTPNGVPTPQKMKEIGFGDETEMLQMLRQKIEEDPSKPRFILTVRGIGYQFEESSGS